MSGIFGRKRVRLIALAAAAVAGLGIVGVANAAGADDQPGAAEPKIIGGGAASEPYPFMASLAIVENGTDVGHLCGASLVFSKWVLTAAHCVAPRPTGLNAEQKAELNKTFGMDLFAHDLNASSFYVRVGSHDRAEGGETANVAQIVVHEDFDWFENSPPDRANDMAMLKLDKNLTAQPIQVPYAEAPQDSAIRLLGWGIVEPDTTGPDPRILQELDTTVAADSQCRFNIPGDITDGEICVDNPGGTDGPCYGDSGGPAIQKGADGRWKLVGVTSRGPQYCGTTATIYSSPPDTLHRKWIYDTARGVTVDPVIPEPRKPETTYTLPYEPPTR